MCRVSLACFQTTWWNFSWSRENSLRKAFASKPITALPEWAKTKAGNVPLPPLFPNREPGFVPSLTSPSNLCNPADSYFSFSSPVVFSALCWSDCPGEVMSFVGTGGRSEVQRRRLLWQLQRARGELWMWRESAGETRDLIFESSPEHRMEE